jgi:murein DD-endopeptidase MepM/ murein hydrolase activator NlpD
VIAAADGVVELAQTDRLLGRMIRVRHETAQMKTLYGHLNKFAKGIRKGKTVKRGETIGYVGNTGQSTGTHLHYGVYTKDGWTNPINYILDAIQNP